MPQSFLNSSTVMVLFDTCPGILKVSVVGCPGLESTCILSDYASSWKALTSCWLRITFAWCLPLAWWPGIVLPPRGLVGGYLLLGSDIFLRKILLH